MLDTDTAGKKSTENVMKIFKIPTPKITGSFKDWLKDYLKNSSVAGCAYYVSSQTRPKERIFWLVIHFTSIILLAIMILELTIDYADSPTVTTEETGNVLVEDVDFPGVAICNVNKISHSAAVHIAKEIMEYDYGGNYTLSEITETLKYLGHLYLFEINEGEEEEIQILHKVLIRRYKSYVPDLLSRLKTPCHLILQYCSWGGKEQSCNDIFFTRKTADGYCCTFNYARQSDDFGGKNSNDRSLYYGGIERAPAPGSKYGLTVLLRPDIGDHHYKILPVLGYKISIFSPMDYPDGPSGTLREVLVSPRMETFIAVEATVFHTVKEVSKYDVDVRDCLFSDELNLRFGGYYSYSDCIMYCRISDIDRLCHCNPFFYPTVTSNDGKPKRICDLKDLRCLKKYKHRWWRVTPRSEKLMVPFNHSALHGAAGSLYCPECFPACQDVAYQVSVASGPLKPWETFLGGDTTKFDNHSLVNIFFRGAGSIRLKQDVMYYWYELMSNYGGLCGFFLGISLISIVEFFYFFTLRLYKRKEDKKDGINSRFTFVKAAKPSLRPLYWHEMIQPSVKY